jgi:hypothetical protein
VPAGGVAEGERRAAKIGPGKAQLRRGVASLLGSGGRVSAQARTVGSDGGTRLVEPIIVAWEDVAVQPGPRMANPIGLCQRYAEWVNQAHQAWFADERRQAAEG